MSIPGEPDHVPFLIKENEAIMIPAINVARFKDGEKVSFFVAESKDEETKVARRIETFSENWKKYLTEYIKQHLTAYTYA